jgi:His-Xaa-Ser repeat protein HxsA
VFDNLSERQELQRYAGHSSHSSHSSHASHSSHYSSSGGGRYLPPAPLYSPPPPTPRTPSYPTLTPRLFDVPSTPGQGQGKPSADELTEMVRTVQLALIARGYDLSFPDGKFGPETRTALKQYQQDSGFNVTGRLDARTLGSLGILGR